MNSFIEFANGLANQWLDGMWAVVWQSAALAAIVYLLTLCIRRVSAAVRFWLWMLVPLRLLVMPLITIGLPLLPAATQPESTYIEPSPVVEVPTANYSEIILPAPEPSTVAFRPVAMQIQNADVARSHLRPSVRAFLMALWLAGISLCSVRLFLSVRRIRRIAADSTVVSDEKVLATAQKAAAMLRLKRMPRLLVMDRNISPFLSGVLRPVLVVPAGLIDNVNEEALYAVFAHEFAHLRRRDPLIGWVLAICEAVYFFHPVLHFVKRRILFEREQACDNWVVAGSKAKRSIYANALISAADACRGYTVKVGPVGAVTESFGDLKKRLLAISRNLKPKARLSASTLILLVIAGAICVPGIVLTARTNDSKGTDLQVEVGQAKQLVAMTILPRGPTRSLEDYYFAYRVRALVEDKLDIESVEMEIRSARNAIRAARIPITVNYIEELTDKSRFPGGSNGRVELNPRQRRLIGELPNGEYLVAVNVNGVRCSNVASLAIDSDFDAGSEPTLRLFPLPVESGRNLPCLGIRAIGPTPQDTQLKNDMIAFADLVVDGMIRRPKAMKWVGPVGPLKPGRMYTRILDLRNYEPEIEPRARHEVKAIVGQYESAPVVIPADDSSGREWDKSTERLPSILPPRIALKGKVIGSDGKPAANHEVHLFGKNGERFSESSGRHGEYEFFNVPSGEYQLVCNPKGRGQPGLTIEQVGVDAGEPLVLNLSLKRQYNFAGKVYYEDGKPATKMDVALTCEDQVNHAEFIDFTTTDANGWYELGGPFSSVSYIGVNGRRIQGPMPGLKLGLTELNYILEKNKRGQAVPINQPAVKTDLQLDDGMDAREVKLALKPRPSAAASLAGRSVPGSEATGRQSSSVTDETAKAEAPAISSSRAWYILRQWNVGPLLLGLTQRLGKVIAAGSRDTTLWTGVANGGGLELDIATEGDVRGEIFVGFFKDAKWSADPVQVRSFPRPGRYTISNLPAGKFQLGAMIGELPVADALGVRRAWPEPVEIKPQVTAKAEVLVSEEFQKHASGWYNKDVSRDFLGDWERLDGENLLQGRVTGPGGRPVSFATVQVREYNPGATSIAAPDCGTSEQGLYKCDRIAYPYRVGVLLREPIPAALGYRHQYLSYNRIFKGSETVDFQFDSFPTGDATLNGRVIDENGAPLTGYHIDVSTRMDWEVMKNPDGKFYKTAGYRIPFVSDDGTFELGGLPDGDARVHVIPFKNQAYSRHQGEEIVLSAGKPSTVELKVTSKNVLFGRVLFKDGSPAVIKPPRWKGAKTSILLTHKGMGMAFGIATVDDDGYFAVHVDEQELAALRSGRAELMVRVPAAEERRSETVGKFPFKRLSRDRTKADVLKIEHPLGLPPSMIDASLPTFDGIETGLSPEQTKGKKVLVCFWDMQQRPSRNLVVELAKWQKELENKGIVVLLAQAADVASGTLKEWLDARKVPFACGNITGDKDMMLFRWGVRSWPWLVLADERGIIRAEGISLDQLQARLKE